MKFPFHFSIPEGFDAFYYLTQNPDVVAAGMTTPQAAWMHYLKWGMAEGRSPQAPAVAEPAPASPPEPIPPPPDPILESDPIMEITLTVKSDRLVGTDGDDMFHAPIEQVEASNVGTLQLGDRIDGGAGFDTLIASLVGGMVAPHLDSIEHLQLSAYYPSTVQAAYAQGLTDLTITQSLAPLAIQQLPDLVNLHLQDLVTVLDAAGQPNHITLNYQPQALAGRAEQSISLDNAWLKPGGTQLYIGTHGSASLNVLDISVIGASSLGGIAGAPGAGYNSPSSAVLDGLHTVRVDARSVVDLGKLATPHLKQLDASASSAGVSVDLSLVVSPSLAIHGGAGDDSVIIDVSHIQQPVHLSTGGGHDTLVLSGLGSSVQDAPVVLRGTHTAATVDAALAARHSASDALLVYWQDVGGQVWLGLDADGSNNAEGAGIQLLATLNDLALSDIPGGLTLIY